jgi:tetratricopeptide (TPR) repeat protein
MNRLRTSMTLGILVSILGMGCSLERVTGRSTGPIDYAAMRASVQPTIDLRAKTLRRIKQAEDRGDYLTAEQGYRTLFSDRILKNDPTLHLAYAQLLEREGKHEEALEAAEPLVSIGSHFDAVLFSIQVLNKWKGQKAVDRFLDQIRDVSLDGLSIRDYEKKGLTPRQTLIFIVGDEQEAEQHWKEAERIYRQLLPEYPPSNEFYNHMAGVLWAQHRGSEVKEIFAQWYLHSSPAMRENIKKHWNSLEFDFKALDAVPRPSQRVPLGGHVDANS